jgi:enamine deaminase RidA (YjgF/YER057c/UK114 family)
MHILFPTGVEEQARLAWCNLGFRLGAAGMTFDNLVKVTTYFPDRGDIPASRTARAEALGNRRPASTVLVASPADPAGEIETEAVACG